MSSTLSRTIQCVLVPRLPAVLSPVVSTVLAADQVDRVCADVRRQDPPFLSNVAKRLSIGYRVSDAERAHIPKSGAVIVVANHPTGILDGIVLTEILGTVRDDIKILANAALQAVEEVSELLIAVDLYGKGVLRNATALRACLRHLASGGL